MPHRPPPRPVLRPGLRVLQRERDVLQVGLDPARAVRLAATPGVRRTLRALTTGAAPADCDPDVLAALAERDLLDDARAAEPGPVVVRRFGQVLPRPVVAALAGAGVGVPLDEGLGDTAGDDRPGVLLLLGLGEPHRSMLDELVAAGRSHLLLRFSEGEAVLGPYVVPGVTACLRCVDAHHAERDSRWPLLVEQQARLTARPRGDGMGDPVDPLIAQLAVAWAVRDLATAGGGEQPPATWSSTIRLPPQLAGFEAVSWLRHPGCGCSLDAPTPAVGRRR